MGKQETQNQNSFIVSQAGKFLCHSSQRTVMLQTVSSFKVSVRSVSLFRRTNRDLCLCLWISSSKTTYCPFFRGNKSRVRHIRQCHQLVVFHVSVSLCFYPYRDVNISTKHSLNRLKKKKIYNRTAHVWLWSQQRSDSKLQSLLNRNKSPCLSSSPQHESVSNAAVSLEERWAERLQL